MPAYRSEAEAEIRDPVVARLRELRQNARSEATNKRPTNKTIRFYEGNWIWTKHPGERWVVVSRDKVNMAFSSTGIVMERCIEAMRGTHKADVLGFKSEYDARALVWC